MPKEYKSFPNGKNEKINNLSKVMNSSKEIRRDWSKGKKAALNKLIPETKQIWISNDGKNIMLELSLQSSENYLTSKEEIVKNNYDPNFESIKQNLKMDFDEEIERYNIIKS